MVLYQVDTSNQVNHTIKFDLKLVVSHLEEKIIPGWTKVIEKKVSHF